MKYFLVILGIIVLVSCHKNKTKTQSLEQKIEALAQQKFQDKYVIKWNESKDYAFIQKKRKTNNSPFPTISFAIYNALTQELLHEDTVPGAQIKWFTKDIIEVNSLINRPRDIHESKKKPLYRYNVKTQQKSVIK